MPTYLFDDEFTGPGGSPPNPANWTYDTGPGDVVGGNGELETYVQSTDNCFLDGEGHLVIRATKTATGYNSARIKTLGRFSFYGGICQTRIKLDPQAGTWPAWWFMGVNPNARWPACGEIDGLENFNGGDFMETSVHTPNRKGTAMVGNKSANMPVDSNWHTYAMVWNEPGAGDIWFDMDQRGFLHVKPNDVPNWCYSSGNPLYILLNLAVGGSGGGDPSGTTFPVEMMVDYMRVSAL